MKRRSFFRKTPALLSLMGMIGLPLSASAQKETIPGRFVHMVFFWLKPEVDHEEFIRSSRRFLDQVDVVKRYHLGTPAMTPREIVDNSYTVALVVTFDSKEDQDKYQKHPVHLQYVEDYKDSWTDVKIFDSWGFKD